MRVIAKKTLRDFWEKAKYNDAEQSLKAWYAEVKKAKWNSSNDIKRQYRNASFVGSNRVVFNIKGNKYRLIVAIKYEMKIVFIRFIGTHEQYDKINAREV